MNWNSHSSKLSNTISRILGAMNRLKRNLPFSALKLIYSSSILSHLQFAITSWGLAWERSSKLKKGAIRIMTNSKYNAHTDRLFEVLKLLKIKDIFDVQRMKFLNKCVSNNVPILLPCSDKTMNCMKFKLEVMNVYIYIRFVLPMPTMPLDIELQSCLLNSQLPALKKPVITALSRLLVKSNFTSSILIIPNV